MTGVRDGARSKLLRLGAALLVLVVIAPFVVTAVPEIATAERSFVVTSASMEPAIGVGSVILVDRVHPSAIERGDIITFRRDRSREPITHRVVGVEQRDTGRYFVTKGDANEEPDLQPVAARNVLGRVMVVIPIAGYVVAFAHTDLGTVSLVVVPGLLLLATELQRLYQIKRSAAVTDSGRQKDVGTEDRSS
jgi:signal peptidase